MQSYMIPLSVLISILGGIHICGHVPCS